MRTSYQSKRASSECPVTVDVSIGRPVPVGVVADDHAVDNGDEVPVNKRYTLGWLGG